MAIKCIAIDDEPLALQQITSYIEKTPFLQLEAACSSAMEALTVMNNQEIQVMFVDVNMPDLSGIDMVKSMTQKPFIIFTTAYSEYAVEGFKVSALDYLLKPFSYSDFLRAANKAQLAIEQQQKLDGMSKPANEYIFVKADYKLVRVNLADITYVESQHEYVKIHLTEARPLMTLMTLKSIEEQLPVPQFMRVHRSYIVNLEQIKIVERNRIVFGDVYVPISEQYKEKFQRFLEGRKSE